MKYLRHIGLASSLVVVGVLGGLMAPLPSEADNNTAPSVTIDGATVALTKITNILVNNVSVCPGDTAFNSCWSLDGTNTTTDATRNNTVLYGRYRVGDYSASNGARILINDSNTGVDNIKMTGITFWPTSSQASPNNVGQVVIVHTFNEGGGNARGDYRWGMAMGGQYDPPSNENVVGSRLRATATGQFTSTVDLGSLDTCPLCSPPRATPTTPPTVGFTSPPTNNLVGYVSQSQASAVRVADCNMAGSRCYPTVTLTYFITIVGQDQLQLSDSFGGCGSSCFTPSDCNDPDGEEDVHLLDCPVRGDLPLCTDVDVEDVECPAIIAASVAAIEATGIQSGGVEACSGDCIVTMVKATPPKKGAMKTFGFTDTGLPNAFNVITNANGIGGHVDKDLITPLPATRVYTIVNYPPGFTRTDDIVCVSSLNSPGSTWKRITQGSNSSIKLGVEVLTLAPGDTLTCNWHIH